jgi:gas vesicle protein
VSEQEAYGEEGYTISSQNKYTVDNWSRKHIGKVAFCLGLFVGAGVTLLLTSMSGKEARGKIVETSKALANQVGGSFFTARDSIVGSAEKSKTWFSQIGPVLTAAVRSGHEAYSVEKNKVKNEIGETPGS